MFKQLFTCKSKSKSSSVKDKKSETEFVASIEYYKVDRKIEIVKDNPRYSHVEVRSFLDTSKN